MDKIKKNKVIEILVGLLCVVMCAIFIFGISTVGNAMIFSVDTSYSINSLSFGFTRTMIGFGSLLLSIALIVCFYLISKRQKRFWIWTLCIIAISIIIRVLVINFWKIEPVSDFFTTFEISQMLANEKIRNWHTLIENFGIYAQQWSAHMPFAVYQTIVLRLFGNSILSIQVANTVMSSLTVLFCILISRKFWDERAGLLAGFAMAIFPSSVMFIPVLTNQHVATMFFMMAIWFFVCKPFKNMWMNIVFSAIATACSHLMRPEMYVVLIAAFCCLIVSLIVDTDTKAKSLKKIGMLLLYISIFLSILLLINYILQCVGIIEGSIFEGNLNYKLLVGLNQESIGMWNEHDAILIHNKSAIDELLKIRLMDVGPNIILMFKKVCWQFGNYVYWWVMIMDSDKTIMISQNLYRPFAQSFISIIIILSCITMLFDKKRRNNLFVMYIVLAGYIATFALIEVQDRYNYIIVPILMIIGSGAFKVLKEFYIEKKHTRKG